MDIRNFDILFLNIHFSRFETKFNGGARYNIKRAREKISFRGGGTPLEYSETRGILTGTMNANRCHGQTWAALRVASTMEKKEHTRERKLSLSLSPSRGYKGSLASLLILSQEPLGSWFERM